MHLVVLHVYRSAVALQRVNRTGRCLVGGFAVKSKSRICFQHMYVSSETQRKLHAQENSAGTHPP
jgi:hypothetical protein